MYSIFHPLDPNEPLPRELILEGRRYRWLDWRRLWTWVGTLYLPALILMIVIMGTFNISLLIAFGIAGVVLVGVFLLIVVAQTD